MASKKSRSRGKKPASRKSKKVGRPSDYRAEFCEKAANLCISGATDQEVANSLKIHVSTLYRWQAEHPEFCEALKAGKELADERVVRSLYHRAVGYTYPAVKIMQDKGYPVIVPYTEHVPPDVVAGIFWLKNRRPAEWRDRQVLEHGGIGGGPIEVKNVSTATDADLEAIIAAGRGAGTADTAAGA